MTLAEEKYEKFLHSSYGAVIFSLVAVAGMFLASDFVRPMPLFGDSGIISPLSTCGFRPNCIHGLII